MHLVLRKSGFRVFDRTIGLADFVEDDTKLAVKLDEKLVPAPARATP